MGFLEIPIKYSLYLPNPCTYISCLHLFKKLLSFSLTFLLLGWEPKLKLLLEFWYSSVVIKINDSFKDHWRNRLYILCGFSTCRSTIFYWTRVNKWMNDIAFQKVEFVYLPYALILVCISHNLVLAWKHSCHLSFIQLSIEVTWEFF